MNSRFDPFPSVSHDDWRRRVEQELADESFEDALVTRLAEGIAVQPLYSAQHPPPGRPARLSLDPQPTWLPCQLYVNPDLAQLAEELRTDLEGGVAGAWLRLDRAARLGESPEQSPDAVGRDGATLYRLQDLEEVFRQLPERCRVVLLEGGASFLPLAGALLAWIQDAGARGDCETILCAGDPLGALARDGRLAAPLQSLEGDLAQLTEYCHQTPGDVRALAVSMVTYREWGADTDQELGLSMATAIHYLRALEALRIPIRRVAAQMTFVSAIGQDIFLEIAKLRALRSLWDGVLASCGVEDRPHPWIHGSVLRRGSREQRPWEAQLGATAAGLAGAIGGVDSLATPALDEADESSSPRGRRLARNIQHILGAESHLDRVLDPAGGSHYLEALTRELMMAGWRFLQQVEAEGGVPAILQSGWLREQIAARAGGHQRDSRPGRDDVPSPGSSARAALIAAVLERWAEQEEASRGHPASRAPAQGRPGWCIERMHQGASVQDLMSELYRPAGGSEAES